MKDTRAVQAFRDEYEHRKDEKNRRVPVFPYLVARFLAMPNWDKPEPMQLTYDLHLTIFEGKRPMQNRQGNYLEGEWIDESEYSVAVRPNGLCAIPDTPYNRQVLAERSQVQEHTYKVRVMVDRNGVPRREAREGEELTETFVERTERTEPQFAILWDPQVPEDEFGPEFQAKVDRYLDAHQARRRPADKVPAAPPESSKKG